MVGTKYNVESFVTTPPTVEQLRFATISFQRLLERTKPTYSKTVGYQSRPVPKAPAAPPTIVPVQPTASSPAEENNPTNPVQKTVRPGVTCFLCGKPGHYAVNFDQSNEQQRDSLKAMGFASNQIEAYFQGLEALNRITVVSISNKKNFRFLPLLR